MRVAFNNIRSQIPVAAALFLALVFSVGAKADLDFSDLVAKGGDETCAKQLIKASKATLAKGQTYGYCARGIRKTLNAAGTWNKGGGPDAHDYGYLLKKDGNFINVSDRYPTPESAPPGAIIVYRGVHSKKRGMPCASSTKRRHGGSMGDYCGHIEIKLENDKRSGLKTIPARYASDHVTHGPTAGYRSGRRIVTGIYIPTAKSCDPNKNIRDTEVSSRKSRGSSYSSGRPRATAKKRPTASYDRRERRRSHYNPGRSRSSYRVQSTPDWARRAFDQ